MPIVVQFWQPGGLVWPAALLVSFGVYTALLLPSAWLFWTRRHKDPLRSRSVPMVLFAIAYMALCYGANGVAYYLLFEYGPVSDAPSQIMCWIGLELVPITFGAYTIRGMRLYLQFMRGKLMMADSRVAMGLSRDLPLIELHRALVRSFQWMLTWRGGVGMLAGMYIAVLVPLIALFVTADRTDPLWMNTPGFGFLMIAQAVIINGLAWPVLLLCWIVNDAFSIRDELTAVVFICSPTSFVYMLALFDVVKFVDTFFFAVMAWGCLLASIVWPVVMSYRYEYKHARYASLGATTRGGTSNSHSEQGQGAMSSELSEHSLSSPTSQSMEMIPVTDERAGRDAKPRDVEAATAALQHVRIAELLADPEQYERLLRLSVLCFCTELVVFCQDVLQFRAALHDASKTTAEHITHATRLTDMYVLEGAPREINIVDTTRRQIVETLASLSRPSAVPADAGPALRGLFTAAEGEAKALIRTNILPHMRVAPAV